MSNHLNDKASGLDITSTGVSSSALTNASNSHNTKSSTSGSNQVAIEFQKQLNSILNTKPPVSKDKMNQIIKEAIKSHRNYKHVVYYVETFIKNCPSEYKLSGLYVIDAIIRNSLKSNKTKTSSSSSSLNGASANPSSSSNLTSNQKDVYLKRFTKNICKTFTNLFNKAPQNDRDKMNKVILLWQKYSILDQDLVDKLNRISTTSKLDSALNNNKETNSQTTNKNQQQQQLDTNNLDKLKQLIKHTIDQSNSSQNDHTTTSTTTTTNNNNTTNEKTSISNEITNKKQETSLSHQNLNLNSIANLNSELITELHKLTSQLISNNNNNSTSNSVKKTRPSTPPVTTKNEISKILEFDNDFDSDSDNQSNLKRKSHSPNASATYFEKTNLLSSSERFKTSISNCAAWIQSNIKEANASATPNKESANFKLPDLSQPPPPLLQNYQSYHGGFGAPPPPPPPPPVPPPPPPPPPVPPPPTSISSTTTLSSSNNNYPNDSNSNSVKKLKTESDHRHSKKEKEKERQRRSLPSLRDKHICICSKTLWLGHLSKSTTEEIVIDELIELLSPSSSNDLNDSLNSSSSNRKKSSNKQSRNYQNIIFNANLIPPRGCAYVEFIDRKTAAKCLERMKDGYRLDGNYIKVAWAANKGLSKDRRMKQYWSSEVGCTYIPWSDLDSYSTDSIDFIKWAEGGLVDEDSLPEKYLTIYKKQILKLANSDTVNSISTKTSSDETNLNNSTNIDPRTIKQDNNSITTELKTENNVANNDMELDTDETHESSALIVNNLNNNSGLTSSVQAQDQQALMQQLAYQNLLASGGHGSMIPINFHHTPPPPPPGAPHPTMQAPPPPPPAPVAQVQQTPNSNSNISITQLNSIHQFAGLNQPGLQLPATILTNQLHPITLANGQHIGFSPLRTNQLIQNSASQSTPTSTAPQFHATLQSLFAAQNSANTANKSNEQTLVPGTSNIGQNESNKQDATSQQQTNPSPNLILQNQLLPLQQQSYVDLLNTQRNLVALRSTTAFNNSNLAQHFQFIQRPLLMTRSGPQGTLTLQNASPSLMPMRNILLPLQTLQTNQALNESLISLNQQNQQQQQQQQQHSIQSQQPQESSTNEITSTTSLTGINEDKTNELNKLNDNNEMQHIAVNDLKQSKQDMNYGYLNNSNWNRNNSNNNSNNNNGNNNNWRSNQNSRRSYQNDYSNRNYSPNNNSNNHNSHNSSSSKYNNNNHRNSSNSNNNRSMNSSYRNSYNNRHHNSNGNDYNSKREYNENTNTNNNNNKINELNSNNNNNSNTTSSNNTNNTPPNSNHNNTSTNTTNNSETITKNELSPGSTDTNDLMNKTKE